jgi:hypothetical protein
MKVCELGDPAPGVIDQHGRNCRAARYASVVMQIGPMTWAKVDLLTAYERLTAEVQVRGRLRETMNDPEPLFHLRNISADPLLPGAVTLSGVPEGLFNKAHIGAIRTLEAEPAPVDQVAERIRRYAMFQGTTFMVSGFAEFPKAASPQMHTEVLLRGRFFQLLDATVTVVGLEGKTWTQSDIWVNRDQMVALFLG